MVTSAKTRIDSLLEKNRSDILKILRSYLSPNLQQLVEPEEILGEVIIYVLERSKHWENCDNDYLLKCILWKSKRLIVDKIRRSQRDKRAVSKLKGRAQEQFTNIQLQPQNPRVAFHREEKRSAMENFLRQIPSEELRQAVRLIWIEELTLREGAQSMGKTMSEFRRILRHGLQALMKIARASGGHNLITTGKTS